MKTLDKAVAACFGMLLSVGAMHTASAGSAECSYRIPLPPDPLPPGFDWTPLAEDWCSQLAKCGFPTSATCVADYMEQINSPILDPSDPPPEETPLESPPETITLTCQDSEEYQMGKYDCAEPLPPIDREKP